MHFNYAGMPGIQAKVESDEGQIWWGSEHAVVRAPLPKIASTAVDASNSPTTTLRQGLVMALNASGLWVNHDPTAGDITAFPRGILLEGTNMLNMATGVAEVKVPPTGIMVAGPVKASSVRSLTSAIRASLRLAGFMFDDEYASYSPSRLPQQSRFNGVERKAANYTVATGDSGKLFVATAAMTFTLPSIAEGLTFEFLNATDATMVISGAGSILADGNASATTLTFSTASHKIGSRVRVTAIYIGAASQKWAVENLGGTEMTVA